MGISLPALWLFRKLFTYGTSPQTPQESIAQFRIQVSNLASLGVQIANKSLAWARLVHSKIIGNCLIGTSVVEFTFGNTRIRAILSLLCSGIPKAKP